MDPNIDVSRRKPRQARGTPSFKYRNRFAGACIVFGTLVFTAFSFTPLFRQANEKLYRDICTETEEEIDRKYLFSMSAAPRRGEAILKTIEEQKDLLAER